MSMLKVENLSVHYGMIQAVRDVSFEVNEGEVVSLIGANGAGKTTILRTLSGLVRPSSGRIEFLGQEIQKTPAQKIVASGLSQVPEGRHVFPGLTVLENLEMGAFLKKNREENQANLKKVFSRFPRLEERKNQDAATLSGGEQQMLAMGRALMSTPKLLLLDEPSMGLAPIFIQEIFDIVAKHKPELARQTDTGFMYNNFNYAILALIIEKITGKTYPEAMKEMVFAPLKMKNTFVFEEKHINSASQSFYQRSSKLYPLDQYDLIYGDKNIYTTPRDLFNFSKALFSKDFLPKELMEKIFEPYSNEKKGVNNYGLGFRLKIFDEGKKLTYHNGWWHGSNTVFIHLRESKTTIIALSNKYSRKIYGTMLLSTLFEDFPFEVDKVINPDAETADSANAFAEDTERAKAPKKKPKKTSADSLKAPKTEERIQKTPESTDDED